MGKNEKKRLSADRVRALPIGTEVEWHGINRYGEDVFILCRIIESKCMKYGKTGRLLEWKTHNGRYTRIIYDIPGKWFTLHEPEKPKEPDPYRMMMLGIANSAQLCG